MKCRAIIPVVGLITTFFLTTEANAIPTYVIDAGQVVGINDLEINGSLWDMQLHDMSFDELIAYSPTNPLVPSDFSSAAATAIVAFIVAEGNPYSPELYLGCTATGGCNIVMPYVTVIPIDNLRGFVATITLDGAYFNHFEIPDSDINYAWNTYATWTAAAIPEPPVVLLLCTGLLGMYGVTRCKART